MAKRHVQLTIPSDKSSECVGLCQVAVGTFMHQYASVLLVYACAQV